MRSDGIAQKSIEKGGLIIINLQRTPYDKFCKLRIYGNLQEVMRLLSKELNLKINTSLCIQNPYHWNK